MTLLTDDFRAALSTASLYEDADTSQIRAWYAQFGITDGADDNESERDADVIVLGEWEPRALAKRFAQMTQVD